MIRAEECREADWLGTFQGKGHPGLPLLDAKWDNQEGNDLKMNRTKIRDDYRVYLLIVHIANYMMLVLHHRTNGFMYIHAANRGANVCMIAMAPKLIIYGNKRRLMF